MRIDIYLCKQLYSLAPCLKAGVDVIVLALLVDISVKEVNLKRKTKVALLIGEKTQNKFKTFEK